MRLTSAQSQIARDTHRFRVVCAGRRFGKTILSTWEMFGKAALGKGGKKICYIAPTYQQARDICWQELIKICQPLATKINETRLEISITAQDGGQSVIWLRGWESIESLRGQSFDFIVIDEIAMMRNFWINWQEVIRPTLTDRIGEVLFISTPKGFNHFYDLFNLQDKDMDYKSFHFSSYDNPNLPQDELDKAKKEITEDRFAQEYMADFRKTEGLVYKEFSRAVHLFDDMTNRGRSTERLGGVDFGFTNPTVILKIEHDYDNNYWVVEEWYKSGQTNSQVIEIAKRMQINSFYPDPAEPDRILEMQNAGLNCREVSKDIEKGVDSVRELFKQNRLRIHRNCINLIHELETYSYPESRNERNPNELPIDKDNHAVDALRYVLHSNNPVIDFYNQDFNLYNGNFR